MLNKVPSSPSTLIFFANQEHFSWAILTRAGSLA